MFIVQRRTLMTFLVSFTCDLRLYVIYRADILLAFWSYLHNFLVNFYKEEKMLTQKFYRHFYFKVTIRSTSKCYKWVLSDML